MALRGEISQTFHEQSLLFLTQWPQFITAHSFSLCPTNSSCLSLNFQDMKRLIMLVRIHIKNKTKIKNIHSDSSAFQVFPLSINSFIRDLKNVSTCSDCSQSNVRDFSMNLNFYIGFITIYLYCISIASVISYPLKKSWQMRKPLCWAIIFTTHWWRTCHDALFLCGLNPDLWNIKLYQ